MSQKPVPRPAVVVLLVGALLLPITICVLVGVGALLRAMGDILGGLVLGRVALAAGIVLIIDLFCLLVVLAVNALGGYDGPS